MAEERAPWSAWDPALYARFEAERSRPFYDLAALVQPAEGMRIIDLGCGSGQLTAWLHERLSARETLGIDSSDTMLAQARARESAGLRFEPGDIARVEAEQWGSRVYDLVISNAALQWVSGHDSLFPRLEKMVAAGGQLAVQMPRNWEHPSHTIAAGLAREEPYRSALGGYNTQQTEANVLTPSAYSELLYGLGFQEQHVRLQVYPMPLPGPESVAEWVSGTLLTAYRSRLAPALYASYAEAYERRLLAALGSKRPYLYTYPRILIWGRKSR